MKTTKLPKQTKIKCKNNKNMDKNYNSIFILK